MSDFTVNDTMVDLRYELDDREIYNDIRSEIGILISETVVDVDADYWRANFTRFPKIAAGDTVRLTFTAEYASPSDWAIKSHSATYLSSLDPYTRSPYYNYSIKMVTVDGSRKKAVVITNTGSYRASFRVVVWYKYLKTDKITHEEITPITLTVRAINATSITKYGRRVMNLTWAEGTEEKDMQSLIDHYITRYAEPVARLICKIKGSSDTLRTQVITREISDLITVICANLGINADCFINSISISADLTGIPVCIWELEIQRTYELLTLFKLGISELGSTDVLGS